MLRGNKRAAPNEVDTVFYISFLSLSLWEKVHLELGQFEVNLTQL